MEGVTESVHDRMVTVGANILAEDGLLLRTCEHGIRHPVGHLDPNRTIGPDLMQRRHETRASLLPAACCGCCTREDWTTASNLEDRGTLVVE